MDKFASVKIKTTDRKKETGESCLWGEVESENSIVGGFHWGKRKNGSSGDERGSDDRTVINATTNKDSGAHSGAEIIPAPYVCFTATAVTLINTTQSAPSRLGPLTPLRANLGYKSIDNLRILKQLSYLSQMLSI